MTLAPGIHATQNGDRVTITVVVGEKTARLTVTRDYARALAAEIVDASMSDEDRTRQKLRKLAERFAPKSAIDMLYDALGGRR